MQGDELYGTGYAVRCALAELEGARTGEVLVTYADVPMLGGATLTGMVGAHRSAGAAITVLTRRSGRSDGLRPDRPGQCR